MTNCSTQQTFQDGAHIRATRRISQPIMKYNALTEQQKRAICEEAEARKKRGEVVTCRVLGEWVKQRFNLEVAPGKSSISRTLKLSDELLSKRVVIDKVKRNRRGVDHRLEKALYAWVNYQIKSERDVNGPLLVKKAAHLQKSANEKLPTANRISLKFSDGWLHNFKRRWGLNCLNRANDEGEKSVHGTLLSNNNVVEEKLRAYSLKNIFNAVEWGLFYNLAPDDSVSLSRQKNMDGERRRCDALAILVCCNADGSEKYQPMFVSDTEDPFASADTTRKQRFDYHANHRAWITCHLFFDWLQRFDAYVGTTPGRNVVLLLSNCSAHGAVQTLPELRHVTVFYLPLDDPRSQLQPCNSDVIALMKAQYRVFQLERGLNLIEEDSVKDVYDVDILRAMTQLEQIWFSLPVESIQKGWLKSGLLPHDIAPTIPSHPSHDNVSGRESLIQKAKKALEELTIPTVRMPLESFLNPPDEDCCIQDISDDALVQSILETGDDGRKPSRDEQVSLPSYRQQLKAIAVVTRLARNHNMGESFASQLAELRSVIRAHNNTAPN